MEHGMKSAGLLEGKLRPGLCPPSGHMECPGSTEGQGCDRYELFTDIIQLQGAVIPL